MVILTISAFFLDIQPDIRPDTGTWCMFIIILYLQILENVQDESKPPYSYAQLIEQAISQAPDKELTTGSSFFRIDYTLLNNEFILKILNSTPFGRKIRKHFRPNNHKSCFSAQVSGFRA